MKLFRALVAVLVLAAAGSAVATAAEREEKVVYHVTDPANASMALANLRNHLNASPKASLVLVANGPGVDFLLEDARDKNGNPYAPLVQELASRKVQFRVCNNTLEARKIDRKRVLPEATVVPSGVAEVSRLQFQEGYAYLKP